MSADLSEARQSTLTACRRLAAYGPRLADEQYGTRALPIDEEGESRPCLSAVSRGAGSGTVTRPVAVDTSSPLVATRDLVVLLAVSLAIVSANMWGLSLISLDDATYARQGVEEGRSGAFFNPTWNGQPDFHKPPLHFWILGRAFALFGESHFAARPPSALLALGILGVA